MTNTAPTPYQQALDTLLGYVDYSRTHQQNVAPENFNLERMRELMARLDNPQNKVRSLHIAGTKGKGSTAAFCATMLEYGGYRTGLYTSPELGSFTERFQVNRTPIAEERFAELVERLIPHAHALPGITSYELQTALAFLYFANEGTDVNVIEVGMGGRLDSTNIIQPLVSIITSISYDHTYVLGNTIEEIAREKGGIIKPGVPVVIGPQPFEAAIIELQRIATERGAPATLIGQDVPYQRTEYSPDGQKIAIHYPNDEPAEVNIHLLGAHQIGNAVTAYSALRIAEENGLEVSLAARRKGLLETRWPGRFEILQTEPPFVLDGAHNRDSAQFLAQTVREIFPNRPIILLFGASEDKDIAGMFAELLPETTRLLLVQSAHPRAATPAHLQTLAAPYPIPLETPPDITTAINRALNLAASLNGVAIATGSLYSIGEIRAAWHAR